MSGRQFDFHRVQLACRRLGHFLVVSSSLVLLGTGASEAADGSPSAGSSEQTQLQEIVVTATKRTTTLQTTPISMTAVSGNEILQRGITDVDALLSQIPGVSFQSMGPGRTNLNVRGLSDTGGSSPTVGFYLDDVPITPSTSAIAAAGKGEISPDLYDLSRVEVLRGPQGTLYGAGSEGGTIRLITNQPEFDRFEASGQATLSHTARSSSINYDFNGMVNLPLVNDQLALRLVGTEKYDQGYIDRIVVSPFPQYTNNFTTRGDVALAPVSKRYTGVNGARTTGGRALLLWEPTDRLSITPWIFVQNNHQGGQNTIDLPPGNFAHYQAGDSPEEFAESFIVYALNVQYDWDSIELHSSTSQMNTHFYNLEDVTEDWYGVFLPFGAPFLTQSTAWERHNQRQFSEELRLLSRGNGALQWLVGAFYSDFKDTLQYAEGSDQLIPYDGDSNVFTDQEPDRLTQDAFFGEATYALLPTLKATAGLRYFHYKYNFTQNYSGLATAPPLFSAGSTSASGVTPKFGLTYLPSDHLTLFANAAKGFRPGSANLPIPPSFCGVDLQTLGVATYKLDSVWSYELGEKARLFDDRVGLRTSGYYIDWKGVQQNVPLACGYGYTTNAGAAVSKGGELEFDARLTAPLTIHLSVGYTDAKITSSTVGSALPVGSPLANVPKWTVNSGFSYLKPLSDKWSLGLRADDEYIGSEYDPNAQPYPVNRRGGYNTLNARIGVETPAYSVYLFASNVLNKVGYVGFDRSEAQNSPVFARVIPTVPRTIGVDVQTRF